jgi:hypothetical protein
MKRPIIYTIGLSAIFCACLTLQSCADTSETTYTTTPYYATSDPYYSPPVATETTTTTYTTAEPDHDSVVGSTVHAAGTIIAAPFRLVGDALSIVF